MKLINVFFTAMGFAPLAQAAIGLQVAKRTVDLGREFDKTAADLTNHLWHNCNADGCYDLQGQFGLHVESEHDGLRRWTSCTWKADAFYRGWEQRNDIIPVFYNTFRSMTKNVSKEIVVWNCKRNGECTDHVKTVALHSYPAKMRISVYDDRPGGAFRGQLEWQVSCEIQKFACPAWFGMMTSLIMTIPHPASGVVGNSVNAFCQAADLFSEDEQLLSEDDTDLSACYRHYHLPSPPTLGEYERDLELCMNETMTLQNATTSLKLATSTLASVSVSPQPTTSVPALSITKARR
ncbi:hypothetical protein HDU67_001369 [Dinochytrium kinnereticum]|nr:hypothetical protein HDU67_001369 [Dinochytrium kinnereticum]